MQSPSELTASTPPRVAYVSGGWASNIGNAYYNLGALCALRLAFGASQVCAVPDVATWVWDVTGNFEPLQHLRVDLCFLSGPTLASGMAKRYARVFDSLVKNGTRIGLVSAGAASYSEQERDEVLSFLSRYGRSIACLATRDSSTYRLYQNADWPVYDGICTSMFIDEAVRVPDFNLEPYVVFNFPYRFEPSISMDRDRKVVVSDRWLSGRFDTRVAGMPIVRTRSETYSRDRQRVFDRPNMFYADTPEGFLAIYKNAEYVFAERVHTCAATLALGGRAMYVPRTPRAHDQRRTLFERVGAAGIYQGPVSLDRERMAVEKQALVRFLRESTA
jgi:hypothetical protein